jgi:hypothetical protein
METSVDLNLDQKNIKLYIQPEDIIISINLLEEFSNNFIKNEEHSLCRELTDRWRRFVIECSYNKISPFIVRLPQDISNYLPNNTKNPGLYCIFGKHIKFQKPLCFYVGMSASSEHLGQSSSIKKRLLLHLKNDLDPKGKYGIEGFKYCFYWLRQCSEIIICWAQAEKNDRDDRLKNKLELLEMCLAVKLRALFLLGGHL